MTKRRTRDEIIADLEQQLEEARLKKDARIKKTIDDLLSRREALVTKIRGMEKQVLELDLQVDELLSRPEQG
jgi:hypothetical protein